MATLKQEHDLAPRVSVLEANVESVKVDVASFRNEARAGFDALRGAVDRIAERLVAQPRATNWYAVAGFVVAAVSITGAIFSLAEWRVSTAFEPLKDIVKEHRRDLRDARKEQTELRIELEIQKAIRGVQSKLSPDAR